MLSPLRPSPRAPASERTRRAGGFVVAGSSAVSTPGASSRVRGDPPFGAKGVKLPVARAGTARGGWYGRGAEGSIDGYQPRQAPRPHWKRFRSRPTRTPPRARDPAEQPAGSPVSRAAPHILGLQELNCEQTLSAVESDASIGLESAIVGCGGQAAGLSRACGAVGRALISFAARPVASGSLCDRDTRSPGSAGRGLDNEETG